jgi:hypothetical protein
LRLRVPVGEGEPGPGDQVLDRPRADDLARPGLAEDAGGDMDRDPADVVAQQLALAGVQAHPDLQLQVPQPGPDGVGRPDGPGRAVEGVQEPVPGCLDLPAPEPGQLLAHHLLVLDQDPVPAAVPFSAASLVESTMSVNSTVASTRSGSTTGLAPVRNSWASSTTVSWSPKNGKWSSPGSSTNWATGMRSAM